MEITNTRWLTEKIFTTLKNRYDQLSWFLYPPVQNLKDIPLLVVVFSLSSFDITRNYSDGRQSADIIFSIHLIFKDSQMAHLNIRDAAFAISTFLHRNNLNHDQIGEIEILSNEPDYFQPEVDGYLSWKIEFLVPFVCGESAYGFNAVSPEIKINSEVNHD
ncbi:hypothetical protein L3V82_12605 [Thiotrichales bacterium 19S3-7]|nr:hypothetical protein [Thiotrichales bacterium 19S3-7]MCF6802785.1 hypothetical protein [Thiotrichales bacterium 19S3-11]